ncbi:MAG: hypothetical protein QM723_01405 [Myxococcaceae bacterium]
MASTIEDQPTIVALQAGGDVAIIEGVSDELLPTTLVCTVSYNQVVSVGCDLKDAQQADHVRLVPRPAPEPELAEVLDVQAQVALLQLLRQQRDRLPCNHPIERN